MRLWYPPGPAKPGHHEGETEKERWRPDRTDRGETGGRAEKEVERQGEKEHDSATLQGLSTGAGVGVDSAEPGPLESI